MSDAGRGSVTKAQGMSHNSHSKFALIRAKNPQPLSVSHTSHRPPPTQGPDTPLTHFNTFGSASVWTQVHTLTTACVISTCEQWRRHAELQATSKLNWSYHRFYFYGTKAILISYLGKASEHTNNFTQNITKSSKHWNSSVIDYPLSCCSKPVRPSFIFWTQIKIFLMKSESFLTLHRQQRSYHLQGPERY